MRNVDDRLWRIAAAPAAIIAFLCLGIAPSQAQSADLKALYDAAKAAGETTVSVYLPAAASEQPVFDVFQHDFPGMKVLPTDIFGAALFARLEAEAASGKPQADVVTSGDIDFPTLSAKGYLDAYTPSGSEALPASYFGANKQWVVWQLVPIGPTVNTTQLTKPGPHVWADLLDPSLKGKMVMTSAATLTTSPMGIVQALNAGVIDQAWVNAFAKQDVAVNASTSAVMLSVAQGQYAMAPFMALSVAAFSASRGAPVEFWYLNEGNPVVSISAGLMKTAPHPNAAKLFMSWLFSENAAKVIADKTFSISTRPGATKPAGMPADEKLIALTGDAMQAALKKWFDGPAKSFK